MGVITYSLLVATGAIANVKITISTRIAPYGHTEATKIFGAAVNMLL